MAAAGRATGVLCVRGGNLIHFVQHHDQARPAVCRRGSAKRTSKWTTRVRTPPAQHGGRLARRRLLQLPSGGRAPRNAAGRARARQAVDGEANPVRKHQDRRRKRLRCRVRRTRRANGAIAPTGLSAGPTCRASPWPETAVRARPQPMGPAQAAPVPVSPMRASQVALASAQADARCKGPISTPPERAGDVARARAVAAHFRLEAARAKVPIRVPVRVPVRVPMRGLEQVALPGAVTGPWCRVPLMRQLWRPHQVWGLPRGREAGIRGPRPITVPGQAVLLRAAAAADGRAGVRADIFAMMQPMVPVARPQRARVCVPVMPMAQSRVVPAMAVRQPSQPRGGMQTAGARQLLQVTQMDAAANARPSARRVLRVRRRGRRTISSMRRWTSAPTIAAC